MKRVLCLVLVCLLVPLYGFAEGVPSSTQTLPISEEPITLEAWVLDVNNTGNLADSPLWDWLAEKTNVRFEVTAFSMSQQEALQLMFGHPGSQRAPGRGIPPGHAREPAV